jgi:hypothetical protein
VLFIDGKNNNNDGMSTNKNNNNDSMLIVIDGKNNNDEGMVIRKNSSDVYRFTVGRQQWKTGRQGRSTTLMAWKDQKLVDLISISKFRIPGVGGVKIRDSSSYESRSYEM